jgi:Tfp pilus assembly protein PilO
MGSSSSRLVVSVLVVVALAIGFWVLLLSPKREKAAELGTQADSLQVSLSEAQSQVTEAEAARQDFPSDYRQLVVLGKAVPVGDETSSLLVELGKVAARSKLDFESIQMNSSGGGEAAAVPVAPAPEPPAETTTGESTGATPASAAIPPTEAAASLLPLGASVGAAGLAVMPYSLDFKGDFFHIADFIKGIDSLVHPDGTTVAVDGRLVTLDGFSLTADPELDFPHLDATFSVTTYVTPPSVGLTAGATPTEPASVAETEESTETPETDAAQ